MPLLKIEGYHLACNAVVFWHCDQASAVLYSKSEEAWGETKEHPGEWELG